MKLFLTMSDKDTVSWNSMLGGLVKAGEVKDARELFDEMIVKDLISWNTMLDGYGGDMSTAFELFKQMPERNTVSWSTMVMGYYLVNVAAGTVRVSTTLPIESGGNDRAPAVVGTNGSLTYRMNLDGFPGFGWAFTYFAEIEDLADDESRKFRLVLPDQPDLSKAIVNIKENSQSL